MKLLKKAVAVMVLFMFVFNYFTINSSADTKSGLNFAADKYFESGADTTFAFPSTYEATISMPVNYTERGGVIIGTYSGNMNTTLFNLEVHENGAPRVYFNDANFTNYDIKFTDVNICTGQTLHLTITADHNTGEFKCYVDGEEKNVGDKITVSSNTTVTAVWEDIPKNTKPTAHNNSRLIWIFVPLIIIVSACLSGVIIYKKKRNKT